MILRPRGHAQSLTKAFVSGSFQMDAHTGAYGTNGAQQYSEDGLPSKGEKELIGMPSVELIPDPDENLTEAEKKAAVCFSEVVYTFMLTNHCRTRNSFVNSTGN